MSQKQAVFDPDFLDDLAHWVSTDRKTALRLLRIVNETCRTPFEGIGKPEPLKNLGPNVWARRLTAEHRVVYRVGNEEVYFLQARYHY